MQTKILGMLAGAQENFMILLPTEKVLEVSCKYMFQGSLIS